MKWAGRTVSDQPDQSSSSDRLKNFKTMQSIKMINLKLMIKVMHNICASHGARVKFNKNVTNFLTLAAEIKL